MYIDRKGQICFYYVMMGVSVLFNNFDVLLCVNLGVLVIDIINLVWLVWVSLLMFMLMIDLWELLCVNVVCGIFVVDNGLGGGGGLEIDLYDIVLDCIWLQLLVSVLVGMGVDGGIVLIIWLFGYEGGFLFDGLIYYVGGVFMKSYYVIDLIVLIWLKMIFVIGLLDLGMGSFLYGLLVSQDGMWVYFVVLGNGGVVVGMSVLLLNDVNVIGDNGFFVVDISEVQSWCFNVQMYWIVIVLVWNGSVV